MLVQQFTEVAPVQAGSPLAVPAVELLYKQVWDRLRTYDDEIVSFLNKKYVAAIADSDTVAAAAALNFKPGLVPVVSEIATAPDYRRQGLGHQALSLIENQARELGAAQLRLYAKPEALEFFKAQGYEEHTPSNMYKQL